MSSREHFGSGRLEIDPAKSVFINCPFDQEFRTLFDAITFSIVCCGFLPRSALETGNVSEPRMQRIMRAIFSSKYSIHDLSRCRGEGDENLARFNMPLELGIAMARSFAPGALSGEHDWLLLVPRGHQYLRFLSDVAGFDPETHEGTVKTIIPRVITWLATRKDAASVVSPKEVLAALPVFEQERASLNDQWRGSPPWADIVLAAIRVLDTRGIL